MAIKPEFIVRLKQKDYPLWAGVLDAATEAGLKSLVTTVIQIPSPENGNLAVVMARAEFADGRVFEDVGDCSPQSTSPHLAAAALRLASTRAKGRALRDSINVGQTMFEELPDGKVDEEETPRAGSGHPDASRQSLATAGPGPAAQPVRARYDPDDNAERLRNGEAQRPMVGATPGAARCEVCSRELTPGQAQISQKHLGKLLCPEHQAAERSAASVRLQSTNA